MQGSQDANMRSFESLKAELSNIDQHLGSQITALQNSFDTPFNQPSPYSGTISALKGLRQSIDLARGTIKTMSSNKHFDIPQPVSSIYTGREMSLQDLKEFLVTPPGLPIRNYQTRFVVHGIGGSGKTQFCCKFAEENRDSFWGVFWIDASTEERVKQTYSQISKLADAEPNENAAMHWLSNLEERWLLIIDNADDPGLRIEKYFPKGNRGHILITTRNPAVKVHGNVGSGYFEFHGLGFKEANDLLLKAAKVPAPWDQKSEQSASLITKSLGFLVLAIVHAGAVIRDGLCTLKDYLGFYERSWDRLRRAKKLVGEDMEESDHHMYVYTTWEVCYHRIEEKAKKGNEAAQDAIQLLMTFSFMHWENIPHDVFRRAVQNPLIEEDHAKKEAQKEVEKRAEEPESMVQMFERLRDTAITFLLKDRSPLSLPAVVRDARKSGNLGEYNDRTAYALKILVEMSLITHHNANESYSMHPIVHKWARERPEMRLSEQALWAEAASMLLSSSLLLPPLRNDANDEDYTRAILPHLHHVRTLREEVNQRILAKIQAHWMTWFVPRSSMNPGRAVMSAKFSLAYAQTGYWNDAEALQISVRDYLLRRAGRAHEKTRLITMALAETYRNQSRGTEAEELQRDILNQCLISLGPEHVDTLRAKDQLGETLWQRGRNSEALELQEEAYHGLQKKLGDDNEDTLSALDHLGRTVARFLEHEDLRKGYDMHLKAIEGMERVHGVDHPRTLMAKENLIRPSIFLGGDFIQSADIIITEIMEARKKKLGKEHPYTLLAMTNAAMVKSALGRFDEAEVLMMTGIPIAERNLGRDHIGTLWGHHDLVSLRLAQGRIDEAEKMLPDLIDRQKKMSMHRGDYHPDRLGSMIFLAKVYRLQGRIRESIDVIDEIIHGFNEISPTRRHPLERDAKRSKQRMQEHLRAVQRGEDGDPEILQAVPGSYGPYSIF
jgi:tetratricopeptide (TPR) repeat protein